MKQNFTSNLIYALHTAYSVITNYDTSR